MNVRLKKIVAIIFHMLEINVRFVRLHELLSNFALNFLILNIIFNLKLSLEYWRFSLVFRHETRACRSNVFSHTYYMIEAVLTLHFSARKICTCLHEGHLAYNALITYTPYQCSCVYVVNVEYRTPRRYF